MIIDLLFVYGTLLNTNNEFGRYLQHNSTFYSEGKLKGRLYDIGEYPGLITGTNNDYDIKGNIYRMVSPDILKAIDDYEGYGDEQDQPNLYIRKLVAVATSNGPVNCWAYFYNLTVEGLTEVTTGNYLNYVEQKRR